MHTTYKSAILQTRGYQTLREHVIQILDKYQLTTVEWSTLGHLYNQPHLRFIDLSKLLGIEAPHVTTLIDQLESKKLVKRQNDPADRRAKQIVLTSQAQSLVPNVETELGLEMSKLLEGITPSEIQTYFKVLETIIKNSNDLKGGEK